MELPNIGGALGGLHAAGHPPVNPSAPTTRRPAFPEGQDPTKTAAPPPATSPHAAPTDRIVTHSQQGLRDALREMKLAETPQNLLIAETLRQFEQAVSARSIQLVATALRGLAAQSNDDVAAAVILLLNDLPVTKENVAALRQLMSGQSMPAQFAKLEGQLQGLLGQLGTLDSQLATLPQAGKGQPGQPTAPNLSAPTTPGTLPGTIPTAVAAAATQAAAAQTQAQAVSGRPVTSPAPTATESPEAEGTEEAAKDGKAAQGANTMAGTASMQRRGEQGGLKRALGGAIGRMGGEAVARGDTALPEGDPSSADAEPTPAALNRLGGRQGPEGQPDARQGRAHQPTPGQPGKPAPAEAAPGQAAAEATARSPGLHVRALDGRLSSTFGATASAGSGSTGQPTGNPHTPPATGRAPAVGPSPTPTSQGPMPPVSTDTGSPAQAPKSAPATEQAASTGTAAGTPNPGQAAVRMGLNPQGGMADATGGMATGGPSPDMPPGPPGLAPRLESALALLRGMNLATTMGEPAHLAQQVDALMDLYGPLHDALKHLGGDLHRYLQAAPMIEGGLDEILALLAKLTGRRLIATGIAEEQRQALLRLFSDVHETIQLTGSTIKEALQQLQAREQLSQANQVFCLPLALPGPPQRAVELLIEPDQDSRHRRDGNGTTRIRLAIETHHLGAVGIDLTSWQQELNIQLQVTDPKAQSTLIAAQPVLTKALARLGFTSAEVSVALVEKKPENSLLLPERRQGYPRSLNRIEGVV